MTRLVRELAFVLIASVGLLATESEAAENEGPRWNSHKVEREPMKTSRRDFMITTGAAAACIALPTASPGELDQKKRHIGTVVTG